MLNNISSFPGVDPIITQVSEAQLPDTGSEENLNSSFSSDSAKASLSRAIKLPYQATHQVELLHLHAEIEALLQQVRTLKQQRLSDSDHLALSDRSILAIR
jgi:hypothetical protein